jgi:hypothetical protein
LAGEDKIDGAIDVVQVDLDTDMAKVGPGAGLGGFEAITDCVMDVR